MSEPTIQALIDDERQKTEAAANAEAKLKARRTQKAELEAMYKSGLDAYDSGKRKDFPVSERNAVKACVEEIEHIENDELPKKIAARDAARKLTKAAEAKESQAAEYEDLLLLCAALRPAVVINLRLMAAHDKAGGTHRSNALPMLTPEIVDGLEAFAKTQKAPPEVKPLKPGLKLITLIRSLQETPVSWRMRLATYQVGETFSLQHAIADELIERGFAVPATKAKAA